MTTASGFDHARYAEIKEMEFLSEVRDMCTVNHCGKYGTSWACPPACGTLEELEARVNSYDYGMILQATEEMEYDFDWEAIERATKRCGDSLRVLTKQMRAQIKDVLPMGVDGCSKCSKCTYPDEPCRFPDDLSPSMEACVFFVNKECEKAGMKYYYGKNTMTINAAIFVKE